MGADKARHNGAAPKNRTWPGQRKCCWLLSQQGSSPAQEDAGTASPLPSTWPRGLLG